MHRNINGEIAAHRTRRVRGAGSSSLRLACSARYTRTVGHVLSRRTARNMSSRVAVVLFGTHVTHVQLMHTYALQCAQSLRTQVLEPIAQAGHIVDVFLSSKDRGQALRSELFAAYQPHLRAWHLTNVSTSRHAKFEIAVRLLSDYSRKLLHHTEGGSTSSLRLVAQTHAFVILTRPDLHWRRPPALASLLQSDRIVWPHPCEDTPWSEWRCVSDMVISVPARWMAALLGRCSDSIFWGNTSHPEDLPVRSRYIWSDSQDTAWHAQRGHKFPDWLASSGHMSYWCASRRGFFREDQLGFLLSEQHRCNSNFRKASRCSRDAPFELLSRGPPPGFTFAPRGTHRFSRMAHRLTDLSAVTRVARRRV